MTYPNDEWQRKGATLSDKTARQEFGLTQRPVPSTAFPDGDRRPDSRHRAAGA